MGKQKIELTEAQQAERKLNWFIITVFILILMLGLKDVMISTLTYFNVLPNWWLIACVTLFACACIWSLDLSEKRMKAMRKDIQKEEVALDEMRVQFQLIYSDILDIKDPFRFEEYCAGLLRALGYLEVEVMQRVTDAGKDIICYNAMGLKLCIEVKYYTPGHAIRREEIQTLFAAMKKQGVKKGMYMTTCDFSSEALEFAQECNIQCINGVELAAMKQQTLILNKTMELDIIHSEHSIG